MLDRTPAYVSLRKKIFEKIVREKKVLLQGIEKAERVKSTLRDLSGNVKKYNLSGELSSAVTETNFFYVSRRAHTMRGNG